MYEQLRNKIAAKLVGAINAEAINKVMLVIDMVMCDYDVSAKTTALATYDYEHIPELLKYYIASLTMQNASEQTIKNYLCILKIFFIQVGIPPCEVTASHIKRFLFEYQQQRGCSARSLDKYRMYISSFFTWAYDNEYITKNPAKQVPKIKYDEPQRKPISQTELEYLRIACSSMREKAVIEFLYSTGCRVSELCRVTKADVDWVENTVHLFGKGKKHRISYLNPKAQVSLKQYLESRDDDFEYLFVKEHGKGKMTKEATEQLLQRITSRSKISPDKKVTPHVIRHTAATNALANGMPIDQVRVFLGHAKIQTTLTYAHTDLNAVHASHTRCVV